MKKLEIVKQVVHNVRNCTNRKFYCHVVSDIVAPSIEEMAPYARGSVVEITAPVWELCESRHNNPIANMGGILPQIIIDPMDFVRVHNTICNSLCGLCSTDDDDRDYDKFLYVVVTGTTQATVELVKVAYEYNIQLRLLHYDTTTNLYRMQCVNGCYW